MVVLLGFRASEPMEREASALLSRRVGEAVELLERGRDLQVQGDFIHALHYFNQVRYLCFPLPSTNSSYIFLLYLISEITNYQHH